MSVFSFVARMIEEALARWKVPAGQLDGELVAANLPPTGNTGSGYTPASHTHPLNEIEQGGATVNDVLTWDGSEWVPAAPSSSGVSDGDKGDIVVSGTGATWTIASGVLSTFGRTLIDDADAAAARTTLGLGTAATQASGAFEAAGAVATHEADTTSVHGIADTSTLYRSGGTDVALADGGTGASLSDPNADRVLFWDDSAGAVGWLTMGANLTITGTTLDAGGGGGSVTQLASGQLGSDGSISLPSISGSYKHLKLILTLRTTQSAAQSSFLVRVNNDTTAGNYHGQRFAVQNGTFQAVNNGATATLVQGIAPGDTALANSFGGYELTFHDYADTGKIKTCLATGGYWQATSSSSGSVLQVDTGGWNSTSAITRIDVVAGSGSLKTGCSYELYGIN